MHSDVRFTFLVLGVPARIVHLVFLFDWIGLGFDVKVLHMLLAFQK